MAQWDPGCAVTVEKEDGSGRAAMQAIAIGRMHGDGSSSRVVRPRATSTPWQCGHGGARHGGAGMAAVERKADGRRAGAIAERSRGDA
jgi:hypothetical protein